MTSDYSYLLVVVLGVVSGLIGLGFKTFLYKLEDVTEEFWKGRPEWALPAVGGAALGGLLLLLPQMYGVGYPVMDKVIAGHVLVWLILLLMAGKVLAASLTLSIGGSGGVFAPSLFIGAMAGMAFGITVHDLFGPAVGSPAMFAVVGMGGVFGAAAQAPLTSVASVVEMTGNFTLTVPVMLAAAIASALSKHLSYGSIYTTKLLRRGIDIDRPRPGAELQTMTVADVMQKLPQANGHGQPLGAAAGDGAAHAAADARKPWTRLVGPVADIRRPQTLFADETLEHALRQLVLYGHSGLPVISHDAGRVLGWVTRKNALDAIVQEMRSAGRETERGAVAAEFAVRDPQMRIHVPSAPPAGYELVEVTVGPGSPALGRRLDEIAWPASSIVVAATERREVVPPRGDMQLHVGERVVVLVPSASANGESATAAACEASAG